MADQKVTARVALITGVDPVNDILPIVDISAGASGSKKITINDLFTGWGMTPAGEAVAKSSSLQTQKDLLGVSIDFDPAVTGLIGGGSTNLDGVSTAGLDDKKFRFVLISGKIHLYIGTIGAVAENIPSIIVADDNPSYHWRLANTSVNSIQSQNSFDVFSINGGSNSLKSLSTAQRINFLPDSDGTLAIAEYVSFVTTFNNQTIDSIPMVNYLIVMEPIAEVTPVNFILPGWDEAKVGQRVSFISDFAVAVFNLSVKSSGGLSGPPLTSLAANTIYEYICRGIGGTIATWKRIK